MNFSKKFQKLRKDCGFSEKKVAILLDVTEETVLKWESGQEYPEENKINKICEIFNCELESLVSEELESQSSKKSNLYTSADSLSNYIIKVVDLFNNQSFKKGLKNVVEMLLILFIASITVIVTINFLDNVFKSSNFSLPNNVFEIVFWIAKSIYVVFILIIVGIALSLIFKKRYLNFFAQYFNKKNKTLEKRGDKKMKHKKENIEYVKYNPSFSSKMFNIILKISAVIFILPLIICLFFTLLVLIISIALIFEDIVFVGVIASMAAGSVLIIQLISASYNIIFAKKNRLKFIVTVLISSFIVMIIGIIIANAEFKQFKVIDNSFYQNNLVETIEMNEDLVVLSSYGQLEYIIDNSLHDKIVIDIKYNDQILDINVSQSKSNINIISKMRNNIDNWYRTIINDIKNKQIIKYNLNYEIKIVSSEDNIKSLLKNSSKLYKMEIIETNFGFDVKYLKEYNEEVDCELTEGYLYKCVEHEITNDYNCNCFYNKETKTIDCSKTPDCICSEDHCYIIEEKIE